MKEQADILWKGVLDPMGDMINKAIDGEKTPATATEIHSDVFEILGRTYVENVSQWHKLANDEIVKAINSRKGLKANRWNIIPEEKMHQINAKLRQIFAIPMEWEDLQEFEFDYNKTRNQWMRDLVI